MSSSTEPESQVVCVLGTHRSGTSLTSRILSLLGFYLGPVEHLMKPNESNPRGFWEHQLLTNLNDEILARLGGTWHEPPEFPFGWENSPEMADLRQRARTLIEQDFSAVPAWSWKDPRACLTLPFWQRLMPRMQYVITLRSPVAVARSLQKRDDFSFQKGINLWLSHLKASLQHSSGQERAFLFYEDLMEDPKSEVERLSHFLGTGQAWERQDIQSQVEQSVEQELYHHRISIVDVVDEPQLAFPAKALYLVFRLAVARHRQASSVQLHPLLDQFVEYAAKAQRDTQILNSQSIQLDHAVTRLKALAEMQRQLLGQEEVQVHQVNNAETPLAQELESVLSALERAGHQAAGLPVTRQIPGRQPVQKDVQIARLEGERDGLARGMTELGELLRTRDQALAKKEAQAVRLTAERARWLEEIEGAHEVAREERARADQEKARQQARLDQMTEQLQRLQAVLASRDKQLADIGAALGWRVLEGYRRLKNSSMFLSLLHSCAIGPIKWLLAGRRENGHEKREGDPRPAVLVLRSTEPERVRRAVQHVREQFPNHEIALALSETERDFFGGWPGVDRSYYYRAHEGVVKGARDLLRALRGGRFQIIVLPTPPGLRSPHFRLFVLFAFLVKAEKRLVMDPSGGVQPFLLRHLLSSVADVGLFFLSLPAARLATALARWGARRFPARASQTPGKKAGALAFLVPVLPDLSHTFIYRELLSLLAQAGRARKIVVVALEEGDYYPLHDEAKELLAHTVFVPSCSLAKYLGLYLYYLLSRPRRMAKLIDFYAARSDGDPWTFLRAENLHGLHPSRGLALTRLLEKEGVGYIHCYGTSYPGTRALVAATLLDVPFSLSTFVDFDYDYAFKCLTEKLDAAEFVVACTGFCKRRLIEGGGQRLEPKIHVIYHALGSHGTYRRPADGIEEPELSPSVFTACRLVEKKGLDYLVRACSILKGRGVVVRCAIIGEGPERQRLEDLVADLGVGDGVRFLGALPNDEIWRQVGADDICVVPSVYCSDGERDGIPVILLEALARGHAVVSTKVSGIPELISDGVHGLLVPGRDAEGLAEAIERLIRDRTFRKRLAAAGGNRVRTEFKIQEKAAQLWRLIEQSEARAYPGERRTAADKTGDEPRRGDSVSVILVNHNGATFVQPLFESLARQTCAPSEVWFFDNSSSDGSAGMAKSLWPGINVVEYERNTGYSFPVNEGIRRSRADYVLVLNVDVVLEERFIEELVGALERYGTAGWAAGRMLKLTGSGKSDQIDCLGHHMSRKRYATETDHSRPFNWRDYERERFVFGASACAALYRASMLEDLHAGREYFDEDFFAYFEDVDLDWRAQLRGWKCVYVPSAVGYHMRGGSGLIKQPAIAACYLANRWLMLLKNDTAKHLARDLVPFAKCLAHDIWVYGTAEPRAVWLAATRLMKFLPRALAKRRAIQRGRVVPRVYIRSLIR